MKVNLEQIQTTLEDNKIEKAKIAAIIKDLEQAAEEEKEERAASKLPTRKWEYLVLFNGLGENINVDDLSAYVLTTEEGSDQGMAIQKLRDAAKEQNESAKRKKSVLQNFGDIFDGLKNKFLKDKGVKIKTKSPVRVMRIDSKTM